MPADRGVDARYSNVSVNGKLVKDGYLAYCFYHLKCFPLHYMASALLDVSILLSFHPFP